MISGIPAQSIWRTFKTRYNSVPPVPSEAAQATPVHEEEPALGELNSQLQALCSIFPDIRADVFREMLSTFSEESRLQVVTEQLLKHKAKWVRGRWRVPQYKEKETSYKYRPTNKAISDHSVLPIAETFRSPGYKASIKAAFYQEFKGLSHSTIKAVLAEYNHSYLDARPTLVGLLSKSWRYSVTNLVMRRKQPSTAEDPSVIWGESQDGSMEPMLRLTSSTELNEELYEALIAPLRRQKIERQTTQDETLAHRLNDEEAEQGNATFDCECCFTASTFEQISTCDTGGHYLCFRCILHTMTEALYGQGWARSISAEKCSLKCIAPSSTSECQASIPRHLLRRALESFTGGSEIWQKFEERVTNESLIRSQAPLANCPFCIYAEVADRPSSSSSTGPRTCRILQILAVLIACLCYQDLLLSSLAIQTFVFLVLVASIPLLNLPTRRPTPHHPAPHPNHGRKFTCRNPPCLRASCLTCLAPWKDMHMCHESLLLSLRQHVEAAQADAVKRTCPRCNLSFVKASGCNKLTCVCGYAMCYVCRKEIGREAYGHFCAHFRPEGGGVCGECERCDLYRLEDEEVVVRRAGERAEREWWERERAEQRSGGVVEVVEEVRSVERDKRRWSELMG